MSRDAEARPRRLPPVPRRDLHGIEADDGRREGHAHDRDLRRQRHGRQCPTARDTADPDEMRDDHTPKQDDCDPEESQDAGEGVAIDEHTVPPPTRQMRPNLPPPRVARQHPTCPTSGSRLHRRRMLHHSPRWRAHERPKARAAGQIAARSRGSRSRVRPRRAVDCCLSTVANRSFACPQRRPNHRASDHRRPVCIHALGSEPDRHWVTGRWRSDFEDGPWT
ncbi:hypothetical protein ADL19_24465 [Streptomyces purpurogeneiscleroticus]|nr:hypothetical protein ADL19_24465 [Streptomyces purpurogeneiscleroticus]